MIAKTVILLSCFAALAHGTNFEDCGSKDGTVTAVHFAGCPPGVDPCVVKQGSTHKIVVKFDSKIDSDVVEGSARVVMDEFNREYLSIPVDSCERNTGITCPIKNGQSYTYKWDLKFDGYYYIKEDIFFKFQLYYDGYVNDTDIVCVKINIKIED